MRSADVLLGNTLVPCCSDHLISTCNSTNRDDFIMSYVKLAAIHSYSMYQTLQA